MNHQQRPHPAPEVSPRGRRCTPGIYTYTTGSRSRSIQILNSYSLRAHIPPPPAKNRRQRQQPPEEGITFIPNTMLTRVATASRLAVARRASKAKSATGTRRYAIAGSGTVFEDREHALEGRAAKDHDAKLIEQLRAELAVCLRHPRCAFKPPASFRSISLIFGLCQ